MATLGCAANMLKHRSRSTKLARSHAASSSTSLRTSILPVTAAEVGRVRRATPERAGRLGAGARRNPTMAAGGTLGGSCRLIPINQPANVDLAGDCGGDQGGAAFLEEGGGLFSFGDEGVEFGGLVVDVARDCPLLRYWR